MFYVEDKPSYDRSTVARHSIGEIGSDHPLDKPLRHIEGEVYVQQETGVLGLFSRKWKKHFLVVINQYLRVYSSSDTYLGGEDCLFSIPLLEAKIFEKAIKEPPKGYDIHTSCCVETDIYKLTFVTQDLSWWVDGLAGARNYWARKLKAAYYNERINQLQSQGGDDPGVNSSSSFDLDILRFDGKIWRNRVEKSVTYDDLLKSILAPQPGHHVMETLAEALAELWVVDKNGNENKVPKDASIYQLWSDGSKFCLLEHSYKLLVVFFPDGSFEAHPVLPFITAREVLRTLVFQNKLAILGIANAALFYRNERGTDELFANDEKPLDRIYDRQSGSRRASESKGRFIMRNKDRPSQKFDGDKHRIAVKVAKSRGIMKENDMKQKAALDMILERKRIRGSDSSPPNSDSLQMSGIKSIATERDSSRLQKRRATEHIESDSKSHAFEDPCQTSNDRNTTAVLNGVKDNKEYNEERSLSLRRESEYGEYPEISIVTSLSTSLQFPQNSLSDDEETQKQSQEETGTGLADVDVNVHNSNNSCVQTIALQHTKMGTSCDVEKDVLLKSNDVADESSELSQVSGKVVNEPLTRYANVDLISNEVTACVDTPVSNDLHNQATIQIPDDNVEDHKSLKGSENVDKPSVYTKPTASDDTLTAQDHQEESRLQGISNDEVKHHNLLKDSENVGENFVTNPQTTYDDEPLASVRRHERTHTTDAHLRESTIDADTDHTPGTAEVLVESGQVIIHPSDESTVRERTDSESSEEEGIVEEFMSSFESSYKDETGGSSTVDNMSAEAVPSEADKQNYVIINNKLSPPDLSQKAKYVSDYKPESTEVSSLQNSSNMNEKRRQVKSLRRPKNVPSCSTCDSIKMGRPFPVLRGGLLEYVSRECTQPFEDTDKIKQMDYICLSGIHLLNVKGEWELADGTELSEAENFPDICFGESIAVRIRKYHLGKFICKLYPSKKTSGRGKWQVLLSPETNSENGNDLDYRSVEGTESDIDNTSHRSIDLSNEKTDSDKQNTLRTSSSGNNLNNAEDDEQFIVNEMVDECDIQEEKKPDDLVNVMKLLPKRMNDVLIATSEALRRASLPRPTDQFFSEDVMKLRKKLLDRMKIAINQVQAHFAAASTLDGFAALGDDYRAPPIGIIVRVTFCRALAEILKTGFRGRAMSLQFLFGRPMSMNLWALVKEVGHSMNSPQMERVLQFVHTCEYAQSDDDRYRLAIAELLNQDHQEQHEKLLMSWFRKFRRSDEIVRKFYMPGTLWCSQGSLTTNLLIEEIMTHLESVCHFPYNLHPDFEWSYMRMMANRDQEDGFTFDRKEAAQEEDAFCFE